MQDQFSAPSLEEEITAAEGSVETRRDLDEIDSEISEIREREELGQRYLTQEEQKGRLQIAPEEITQEEMDIILAFTESLAEGTGAQYAAVMPSSESALSGHPALESLNSLLSELLKAAAALLDTLWGKLTDYWEHHRIRIRGMINLSTAIRNMAEEKIGRSYSNKKLSIVSGKTIRHLSVGNNTVKDFGAVRKQYSTLQKTILDILKGWCKDVADQGEKSVEKITSEGHENVLNAIEHQNELAKELWKKLPRELQTPLSLLGGVSLVVDRTDVVAASTLELAKELQRQKVIMISDPDYIDKEKIAFTPFQPQEVIDLMDDVKSVGLSVLGFIEDQNFTGLERRVKQFTKDAYRKLDGLQEPRNVRLSTLIDYPIAYSRWVKTPAVELSSLLLDVSRTLQQLAKESLLKA
ncbi:hypothetical protein MOA67_gp173 [Klebsiella phage KpLz-2_45]|uniref:hypothetical protein n=1 Tax=Klebsiella phage KpLz-2_45 TaxID=2698923 RepID=UPI001F1332D7|nr:hypothetical protein MOA67_gp173 [Klebsiella phage KpLz-2_45]UKS72039.1 hypothetical protein KpLz245_1730 [Klebsiella phage KpLz-2_45]